MITITKTEIALDRSTIKIYCTTDNTSVISSIYVDILSNKTNILSLNDSDHSYYFADTDITKTTIDSTSFYLTITATQLNDTKINRLYIVGLKLDDNSIVSVIVSDLYELYPLKLEIIRNLSTESIFEVSYRRYSKLILKEDLFVTAKLNNDINTALNIYQEILNV